jgi:hypothetical protein
MALLDASVRVAAPPAAREYLAACVATATRRLARLLRKRWLPDRRGRIASVHRLVRLVATTGWDSAEADRRYLCHEIARVRGAEQLSPETRPTG